MITAEQRSARRHRIGSSDSPAIVGVDRWRSPGDVYLEKVYQTDDLPNKGPILIGNLFEPVLVAWAAEQLGIEVEVNVSIDHHSGVLAANLDARGLGAARRIGIEAKAKVGAPAWDTEGGQNGIDALDKYGEPGSDEVPDRVTVQTLHQCEVAELDEVYVPVLLIRGGRIGMEMFRVGRNEPGQALVVERGLAFWNDHVLPRVPPPAAYPSLETLKRVVRAPGSVVDIDAGLVEAWEAAKAVRKQAEEDEDARQAALLAALGDAEAGDFGNPLKWLTYLKTERKGYEVNPTSYRVPRVKKRF